MKLLIDSNVNYNIFRENGKNKIEINIIELKLMQEMEEISFKCLLKIM